MLVSVKKLVLVLVLKVNTNAKFKIKMIESISQNDLIYYDASPIQMSHNQQKIILVNAIKNNDCFDDVLENTTQEERKSYIKNEDSDMSSSNFVKNALDDGKTLKITGKESESDDVLKEDDKTDIKITGENLTLNTTIYAQNEPRLSSNANTGSIQNQNSLTTTILSVGSAAVSKIPILQSNLRQAKCASWAGGELVTQQIPSYLARNSSQGRQTFNNNAADIVHFNEVMSLTPPNCVNKPNVAEKSDGVVFQNPDITDLTPAMRRRRELNDKYISDPSQLQLRFTRPRSRNASRTRGVPTTLLGQFEDNSSDTSDERILIGSYRKKCSSSKVSGKSTGLTESGKQMDSPTENEMLLTNLVKDVDKTEHSKAAAIRNDITPPPGAPKIENTARLRRYRHNID